MKALRWLFALLLVALPTPAPAQRPARPNVVLILADDLGWGDVGAYGATRIATPNIDRLAREGRRYLDAHSPAAVCSPSRYNLLTGRYSWRTYAQSNTVWAADPLMIEPARFTLADLFKSEGYRTAVVGKWHLGFGAPGTPGWDDVAGPDYNREIRPGPLDVGFDYAWVIPHVGQQPHFVIENRRVLGLTATDPIRLTALREAYRIPFAQRPRPGVVVDVKVEGGKAAIYDEFALSDRMTERAVSYIRAQDARRPFFLYFAHRSPHSPYRPARRFAGRSAIGPYGDMLLELDDSVGQVLQALDARGLSRNTVVILTSDNGAIGDYTREVVSAEVDGHRRNGPWRGQKTDAYEGGHRVPLIVRWPDRVAAGTDSRRLVALTDVLATFGDYFRRRLPANAGEDSFSFLADLTGRKPAQPARQALVSDSFLGVMSLREGGWKLIAAQHGGGIGTTDRKADPAQPPAMLFNLDDDPAETTNLYAREPERAAAMAETLRRYQAIRRTAPQPR